ncbi:MAG TPA: vanadium-dependent haloperoxidase [Phycisphaerae bacterium]|nr:vanadium-dependent haloperoxidase [Phycisphaerae bacterium]
MRAVCRVFIVVAAMSLVGCDAFSSSFQVQDPASITWVTRWNQIAVDASGLDHTPPKVGEDRVWGQALGPGRAARAMAMAHIAIFEAVNSIAGTYESYLGTSPAPANTSMKIAIAQAAHDTLVSVYSGQTIALDGKLQEDLDSVADGTAKQNGVDLGHQIAAAIVARRAGDGSTLADPYTFSNLPGKWRVDPMNPTQQPLGSEWGSVGCFVMHSGSQFRAPPPPDMTSTEYTDAYNEVKGIGGDGVTTPTTRTEEQTQIGLFWAYDGTPSLCAPPRMYNQLVKQIATDRGLSVTEMARLLALTNVAMADAAVSIWDAKYYYNLWRPVTGIRESDPGTGPTGDGDGNPDTIGDPNFTPMGAPASNLTGPNFTPPFPSYPSGHAGFGGAVFETLRNFFGTDDISFTFVSDELNGVTVDHDGNIRPLLPRSFSSLSQAEEENGQSRIYLGIHWSFDKTQGIAAGRKVGDFVFNNAFRPKSGS